MPAPKIQNRMDKAVLSEMLPSKPEVPRQIWALWGQGVDRAPPMQKTCLWSHRAANPTFTARVLDLQSAINLTDVFSVIARSSWDKMSIQASVARWQNLIPSFPWIAPGWRAWGHRAEGVGAQSKERRGSNFAV